MHACLITVVRAEVDQVDQEWRRRWQQLQSVCNQLQEQVDAAACAAAAVAVSQLKDVEAVRWGCVMVVWLWASMTGNVAFGTRCSGATSVVRGR